MVALEAKPLPTLPWCEIDATGPVLLLVVPQVNKEIDKRKRDGRLGKRAREFNRLIRPAALSRSAVQICAGPPAVDLGIAALDRIDWDALNDLDPEEPDACVIAQILHARGVPLGRKLLLSDDTNPISMATRHGLRTQEMPTHWRLEPEPSPHEKEISRLKARVKELESTEPELKPSIEFSVDAPLQLFQVRQLSDEEKADLVARILAKNPRAAQNRSVMLSQVYYDHTFDERYERYRIEIVPRYAATLHRHLETLYGQVPFLFRVENVGHVQAENLVVTLTAIGGRLHDRFACYALFGPLAPQPRPHDPFQPFDFQTWPLRPGYAGRHEMDFAVGPNRGDTIEVHCQDFRQGVPWQFSGMQRLIRMPAVRSRYTSE